MPILYTVCVPHPPLIIPNIGRGREKDIQKTIDSYEYVMKKVASYHPDTVIIISPHSIMYSDYLHISPGYHAYGDFGLYHAGNVEIECDYDSEFVRLLESLCNAEGIPAGTLGERDASLDHATMIPLYFLQKYTKNFKVIRTGISGISFASHYAFGQAIAKTAEILERNVVIVASGDLSHKLIDSGPYGYVKEGPEFDKKITHIFETGDFLSLLTLDPDFCDKAAECGLRAFQIMAGALDKKAVKPHLYSYEGPFGVGYGVADFEVIGDDPDRDFGRQFNVYEHKRLQKVKAKEDVYVQLARKTIETYIKTGKRIDIPEGLPEEMLNRQAGVFVSLHKDGQLRGCIGTFQPTTECIAQEIIQNAISACSRDPRFNRVMRKELKRLVYSVDVLGEVEPVHDINELDPKRYGVIVSAGRKRGLLLPDLPDVDTVTDQIEIARQKAHIHEDQDVKLERFEVVRHT